jgi:hypothetical protein
VPDKEINFAAAIAKILETTKKQVIWVKNKSTWTLP